MPIISVFPDVVRAYNRVEVNWADTPAVQYARVLRVDVESGTCTPLRPYICYNGDYLLLSCGHGIFFDTEVPLDRQVYYITEGLDAPCIPSGDAVSDTFSRVTASGWGTADTGQTWAHLGAAADFFTNGVWGQHSHPAANTGRTSTIDIGRNDGLAQADFSIPALASGTALLGFVVGRFTDTNNFYQARIGWTTGNTITLTLRKRVAGVETNLISITVPNLTATINTFYTVKFEWFGTNLRAKLWEASGAEPADWQVEATDAALATGTGAGIRSILDVGSTNTTPFVYSFDNFLVPSCEPCTPVTADTSADPTTMPSNGAFRLRDPVRPCNDIYMPLCFEQSNNAQNNGPMCIPGSGVFFASMETESYDDNSLLVNPTNAKYPISINRDRRGVSSTLTVVTRTFADRDNVITLNKPGSPLLIQGPPQYGIPDRYMAVRTVGVDRGLTNHKRQPRIIIMPFDEVARPAGPTQGVCGSQVADLCDIYSTWDEMAAAGLTWDDLVRGRAGAESAPGFLDYRTWDEVEVEFADWNAVDDGTRTWHGLEIGD